MSKASAPNAAFHPTAYSGHRPLPASGDFERYASCRGYMRVDLALFDGDDLLDRKEITGGPVTCVDSFRLFQATHQLGDNSADIVLGGFAESLGLNKITLDMPIHESNDWESIDLGSYALAFWCRLDA